VAAPVISLVEPRLMPQVMLWLAFTYPLVTLSAEREDIHWAGLGWSLPSRVLGTGVGVAAVATFSSQALGLAVAVMVLAAVLVTWLAVRPPMTRSSLVAAGLVGGFAGTATSIGGPPLAILYQDRPPRQIRTTLAVYFMIGAALSLVGLGLAGELDAHHALIAAALAPVLPLGAALGRALRPRLPERRVRGAVLIVCASSALVLGAKSLL
jgi:uncharacterized membrane protein YfcA